MKYLPIIAISLLLANPLYSQKAEILRTISFNVCEKPKIGGIKNEYPCEDTYRVYAKSIDPLPIQFFDITFVKPYKDYRYIQ
ncbi:MAG: hypothetical protein OXE77_11900 [Flavobacteriaceae bacterium]|nr:hypothetical protein [Flavobacteriaceae bacterium]MCY4266768.1 hypothetical protein [Flavobacteriaceae bacterium]